MEVGGQLESAGQLRELRELLLENLGEPGEVGTSIQSRGVPVWTLASGMIHQRKKS
jgi:hypothetical protein